MRYPLWAFLLIFVVPPFTAHALLAGHASFKAPATEQAAIVEEVSLIHHRF